MKLHRLKLENFRGVTAREVEFPASGVVVLTGRATSGLDHQALITDLLPAGFEIDNPRIVASADLANFGWLGQTEAAHALCHNVPKARQKHLEVKGAGHYGIFSGRRWRQQVYPQVRDFIAKHAERDA